MKRLAEADTGRKETGTGLQVSVLVYLRRLARQTRSKAAPNSPPLRSGRWPLRLGAAAPVTVPRHRRVPGGETIDTAACTVPRAFQRRTCVSSRGQELELVPESVKCPSGPQPEPIQFASSGTGL